MHGRILNVSETGNAERGQQKRGLEGFHGKIWYSLLNPKGNAQTEVSHLKISEYEFATITLQCP